MNYKWYLAGIFLILKVTPGTTQMDSLIHAFSLATNEKDAQGIANSVCQLCDSTTSCYIPFLEVVEEPPVNIQKVRAIFVVTNYLFRFQHSFFLTHHFLTGIRKAKQLDPNHPILGSYYTALSNTYKFLNVLDSALIYADLCDQIHRYNKIESAYWKAPHLRYQIFIELKDYEKADEYIRTAYDLVKNSSNRLDKGFVLYCLIEALHNRGTKEEFNKYVDEFIRFKAENPSSQLDGRHIGILEFFEDSPEALATLEKRIKYVLADSLLYKHDMTHLALAEKYTAAEKYDSALGQLDAIPESTNNSITAQKDRYQQYYEVYKKMGRHENAYQSIEHYIELQDSSYQQILKRNIAEHEVRFQTKEKEREIISKDLQLTRSRLVQRSYFSLSGFLAVAFLTGIILHRRKLKYQRVMNAKEAELQAQKIHELEQKNKLLSLSSIIEGQEAERLRIAQDLHDGLGGMLTTVKAHFNSIQREIDNIQNLNVYAKTNQLIDDACVEVRRIAHDMVPYSIKISGLTGALEDLKQSIITRGPQCEIETVNIDENLIPEHKANMIYRIMQEITNNAVKHATASKIFIQLMQHEKNLHIMIEDNGKGFDINNVVSNRGMGLKSIDSRVNYLGGKINYDSSPGQGTIVNVEVPL